MDNKNIGCGCNSSNNCSIESQKKGYIRAGISFILMMVGILLSVFNIAFFENKTVQFIWYVIAYIPVGLPVIIESYQAIKQKIFFSEFTLMCIATFGAFYIGEYPEAVAVMLFYAIGELFQDSAVNRAKKNISALIDVRPQIATIVINGKLKEVPPESVKVGNIIEVKVGQRVPLDGKMLNDYASFNTSALTGESVPRKIRKGENVLAGMILTDNVSRIEVTKPFGESALSRILDMVQNATEHKAPAEQFTRKFAKIYTPIVVILAILIVLLPFLLSLITPSFNYIFNDWLYRGLVFLVISCPCALVVSIPLSYFGGIGLASRNGILFKGSNYLEAITKVNTIVMDKTGTLTQGVFSVQKIAPTKDFSETELIHFISSIETQSSHPIAKAIVEYANKEKIELAKVSNVSEIAGYGLDRKSVV